MLRFALELIEFILQMRNSVLKIMDFSLNMMNFVLNTMGFVPKLMNFVEAAPVLVVGCGRFRSDRGIQNDEFFPLKMMNIMLYIAFKMMNFAGRCEGYGRRTGSNAVKNHGFCI